MARDRLRYGLGLVESLLAHAIEVGRIPQQPVSALAHVLMGALDEAALYVARAEDQAVGSNDVREVITRLIASLGQD